MPAPARRGRGRLRRGVRAVPDRLDRAQRDLHLPALGRDRAVRVAEAADRRLSRDRRIQALLIAFASARSSKARRASARRWRSAAAMLIGLGFKPLEAAKLALIGNTAPVAFGSLGIPLVTLAPVTGPRPARAQRDGRAAAAVLLADRPVLAGRGAGRLARHARGVAGVPDRRRHVSRSCSSLVSNFHGPWLVDIVGAAVSMVALVVLLRFWKPADETARRHADVPAVAVASTRPPVRPGRRGCRGCSFGVRRSSGASTR